MKTSKLAIANLFAGLAVGLIIAQFAPAATTVLPAMISKSDMQGSIFDRPETARTPRGDFTVLDVTTLISSDGKFASGMFRAGKSRFDVDEPWGVDEFMYFVEGGVTLTSEDGTVQEVRTGEAVTIPREWTGVWETDGYTKIWVIYSEDGSGL